MWGRILKGKKLSKFPGLMEACEEMYHNQIHSPLLLGVLVDMYQETGDRARLSDAIEVSM